MVVSHFRTSGSIRLASVYLLTTLFPDLNLPNSRHSPSTLLSNLFEFTLHLPASMCHTNWKPDAYETEPRTPGLRPVPQLKWVIPVDIVELGASLEANLKQRSQVKTLRLCHRFGEGALSKVPQEILDYIISHTHQLEKAKVLPKWYKALRCFQGRCTREQHLRENSLQTEYLFNIMFVDSEAGIYKDTPLDPQNYTEEEMRDMVEDQIDEDGYESWDDSEVERHWVEQDNWLDLVCQCENTASGTQKGVRFSQLVDVSVTCM